MRDYLASLGRASRDVALGRKVAQEYLQERILQSLQRSGAMQPLAFQGGTALRYLYALPRYSRGLDFSLERGREQYDLRLYLEDLRRELSPEG